MTPTAIRARILAARRALDPAQRSRLSAETCRRFLELHRHVPEQRWRGARVALYRALAIHAELDPMALEREWSRLGARLHFARVTDTVGRMMEMVEVPEPQDPASWVSGAYGMSEPRAALAACDPSELDLILIPGVAFGPGGERIGLGGGFYDRYLPRAARAFRLSLAFDLQIVGALPRQPWDQGVDLVVTEGRETSSRRVFDTVSR